MPHPSEEKALRQRKCKAHGRAFKAEFWSVTYKCGAGCSEYQPNWYHFCGWAMLLPAKKKKLDT